MFIADSFRITDVEHVPHIRLNGWWLRVVAVRNNAEDIIVYLVGIAALSSDLRNIVNYINRCEDGFRLYNLIGGSYIKESTKFKLPYTERKLTVVGTDAVYESCVGDAFKYCHSDVAPAHLSGIIVRFDLEVDDNFIYDNPNLIEGLIV